MPSVFSAGVPLACVPIVAATVGDVQHQATIIRAYNPAPDLVELRADHVHALAPHAIPALLADLQAILAPLPILYTDRCVAEGGVGKGDEVARIARLHAAIASGHVALVDVELATEIQPRIALVAAAQAVGVSVIISAHDFVGTPDDAALDDRFAALIAAGGTAAKLAVTAQTPEDALRLLRATARAAAKAPIPLISMAMGSLGTITRLAGPLFGSVLTYATIGPSSAPGQLPLHLVRAYWHHADMR
jgi:3-dehydroquinate dehydratase-1